MYAQKSPLNGRQSGCDCFRQRTKLNEDTALSCLTMTKDPSISIITDNISDDYRLCVNDLLHGTSNSKFLQYLSGLKDRLSVSEDIILLDSKRIVVPSASVPHLLCRLHTGHCGHDKTLKLAQSLFYWPGMSNDIKTFISSCRECFAKLPSQSSNPYVTEPPSTSFGPPFAAVGLDLFEHGGNKFLICVDKWSGYPDYKKLQTLTAKAITNHLQIWFNLLGWPSTIHSEGGPQFCGYFRDWCLSNSITDKLSVPYNPKSNGLANLQSKT